MKRNICISAIILIIFATVIISFASQKESVTKQSVTKESIAKEYMTYKNDTYKFDLKYPKDWTKKEGYMDTIVFFEAPSEKDDTKFRESVNIVVQNTSLSADKLDEYTKNTIQVLEKSFVDFKFIASDKIILSGKNAHKLIYSTTQGQLKIKYLQVYTIKDNKVYLFTFGAEENKFDEKSKIATEMLKSFEVN